LIVTGVTSPQIFGARKNAHKGEIKKKTIESELGIDFIE